MTLQHLYRRYTPREWLLVLLLICLSGYITHNEYRAALIIRAQNITMESNRLQTELIRLNRRYSELLVSLMVEEHRRVPQVIIPTKSWKKWELELVEGFLDDYGREEER